MRRYAVVKSRGDGVGIYRFTKFHSNQKEAWDEAIRLVEKEGERFFVLKIIGYAERKIQPVVCVDLPNEEADFE